MKRKVGQDMVIKKKTSTPREVSLPTRSIPERKPLPPVRPSRTHDVSQHPAHEPVFSEVFSPRYFQEQRPARGGILWFFALGAIIGLAVTVLSLITHATIDVHVQEKTYSVDTSTNLYTEPTDGQIAFKTAKIVDKQSVFVPTINKQSASVSATGTVQLFSTATKPTAIPAGTQLISTAKKTFTTKSKIIIPAGTTKNPGSASVTITATVPGVDSNIKLDDLKLPSFPGVIAHTTTEVTGGISGDQFILNDAELTAAKATLEGRIANANPAAFLANQIPNNFIIPESLVQVSDTTYSTESGDNGVTVIAERSITGNMIDRDNFKQFLISQIPETDQGFMNVFNDDGISFALSSATSSGSPSNDNKTLPVHITGIFIARAGFSESDVRTKIAHVKKTDATQTIQAIPGVISAQIHMWPPWIRRIPNKVSAIEFKTIYQSTP